MSPVARDTIFLRALEVRTVLGVEDWEREEPQTVLVDVEFLCDAARAAVTDDVRDAFNYRTVAKEALAFGAQARYHLVETLADRMAAHLMERCGLPWLRLRVSKPGAIRFSREVGVEIERGRC